MLVARLIILLLKHKQQRERERERERESRVSNYDKYITTPEFNNFSGSIFDERLKQVNLATKPDLDTVSQRAIKLRKK